MPVLCPLCVRACFSSIDALQCRLIKACNGPLPCPICNETFMGLDKLTIHLFLHTNIKNNHLLEMTSIVSTTTTSTTPLEESSEIKKTDASIPMVIEDNTAIKQDSQYFATDLNDYSNSHRNLVNSPSISMPVTVPYEGKCNYCSKSFTTHNALRDHIECEHFIEINSDDVDIMPLKRCEEYLVNFKHTNGDALTIEHNFIESTNNNNNNSNNDNNNNSSQNLNYNFINVNNLNDLTNDGDTNTKLWKCDTCTKCFTTKYFLKKHKRLHTGEMPYTCEICGRTFTFQQSYHKHLMYHSDEKPHTCTTCGRAFKELSTMKNHERIHSGEKPYKCDVCGKCFRQRVSFLVHSRIHTGVMPYKCEICNKSFRYKVTQRTHKCQLKEFENVLNSAVDTNNVKSFDMPASEAKYQQSKDLSDFNVAEAGQKSNISTQSHDTLSSDRDGYLSLLDIQNIHLFSPPEIEMNATCPTFLNTFE